MQRSIFDGIFLRIENRYGGQDCSNSFIMNDVTQYPAAATPCSVFSIWKPLLTLATYSNFGQSICVRRCEMSPSFYELPTHAFIFRRSHHEHTYTTINKAKSNWIELHIIIVILNCRNRKICHRKNSRHVYVVSCCDCVATAWDAAG